MPDPVEASAFVCQVKFDQPELLGARWWQQRLADAVPVTEPSRRDALRTILIAAGVLGGGGLILTRFGGCSTTASEPPKTALQLQRERGWRAGETGPDLTFPSATDRDASGTPFGPEQLDGLAVALAPKSRTFERYYVPTLFQVLDGQDDAALRRVLRPILTDGMRTAHAQGTAVRGLFEAVERPADTALVVDLDGPESVAFAAGLTPVFTPVFTFDNWPHPRGVVPAHLTLAAAVYYAPVLRQAAAPPAVAFVLDRARLSPYRDEPERFDNRYVAKLPPANDLLGLGIKHLLYVVPKGAAVAELDDLNELFVALRTVGIDVKTLSVGDLTPAEEPRQVGGAPAETKATPAHHYGGSPFGPWWFWMHYGWHRPAPGVGIAAAPARPMGSGYVPSLRQTLFSGASGAPRVGLAPPAGSTRSGSWSRSRSSGTSG